MEFSAVHLLSRVQLFATPWAAARQGFLSITNSRSLLKLMSAESVMPCNHLILCRPLLLPPSIFPGIRFFSSESGLHIKWPKYRSYSFSISGIIQPSSNPFSVSVKPHPFSFGVLIRLLNTDSTLIFPNTLQPQRWQLRRIFTEHSPCARLCIYCLVLSSQKLKK